MHIGTSLLCTSFRIMGRDLPPCLDLRVRTETASPARGRFLTTLRKVYVIGGWEEKVGVPQVRREPKNPITFISTRETTQTTWFKIPYLSKTTSCQKPT